MVTALGNAFTSIINYVGEFLTALTDTTDGVLAGLLPLFAIGIAISLVMVCVKIVRKVVWGA